MSLDAYTTSQTNSTKGAFYIDAKSVTDGFEAVHIEIESNAVGVAGEVISGIFIAMDDNADDATDEMRAINITGTAGTGINYGLYTSSAIDAAVYAQTGYIRVGHGSTPDVTPGDDDLFVEGTVEIDVATRFDGDIDINSSGTTTNAVTIDGTQTSGILLDIYSNASNTGGMLRVRSDGAGSTGTVLSLRGDGTGDLVNMFDGDGTTEVVTIEDGGLVGLNNSNPAVTLDITGVVRVITGTFGDTDLTPDVSGSNTFLTVSNTGATAITDLDNPNTAQRILIICNNATNPPTIADSGNFTLSAAWAPGIGDTIELFVRADNDYVEISRSDN
jgi:hypothetical protein